ncbi:MAG: hypothetical protein CXT73_04415, partial [Methanobacteriota archaeon]
EWESEEELPKAGTKEFSRMFQTLGRKYQAKKDDESKKKSKKSLKEKKSKLAKKLSGTGGDEIVKKAKKKSKIPADLKEKIKNKKVTEEETVYVPSNSKLHKKKKKKKKKDTDTEEEESEKEEDEKMDKELVEYLENMKEEEEDMHSQARDVLDKQFNIIFTTGPMGRMNLGEEEESETEDDIEVIISSDEEETKKLEEKKKDKSIGLKKGDRVKIELKDWDKPYFGKILKSKEKIKQGKPILYYDIELDETVIKYSRKKNKLYCFYRR